MKIRVTSLFLAVTLVSVPVFAQGPPGGIPGGGVVQLLANNLAALTERVSKLEGNIVASDLAGTYSLFVVDTQISAMRPGIGPGGISFLAQRATLRLNADLTGTASPFSCEGSTLTGTWTVEDSDCSEPAADVTWTYADGVITITFLSDGDEIPLNVALGGRLLINAGASFSPRSSQG